MTRERKDAIIGGVSAIYNDCPFVDITIALSPYLLNDYKCRKTGKSCEYVDQMRNCPIRTEELEITRKKTNENKKDIISLIETDQDQEIQEPTQKPAISEPLIEL